MDKEMATDLVWPIKPTCHTGEAFFSVEGGNVWHKRPDRTPLDDNYRHCSYCGSLHPEDLIAILANGGEMHGSDWKYGYPHKFYIDIPNPRAGEPCEVGSSSYRNDQGVRVEEKIMGTGPSVTMGKFYTNHLRDEGYSDSALDSVMRALSSHSGIAWYRDGDGEIHYHSPSHGFQH